MDTNYITFEEQQAQQKILTGFFTKVYGWMCAGLLITALTAWYTVNSEVMLQAIFGNRMVFFGLIIAELVLVGAVAGAIQKLSVATASLLFVVYSALTGLTLSVVFLAYTAESITNAFLVAGATFGGMSLFGLTTKKDLTSWGRLLFMALIGLIIATVVNIFWASSTLYWITTYAGVLIFTGLIAYDSQKLKMIALQTDDETAKAKLSILGALSLYLDFINLFLMLLRIFGQRK